MLPGFRFLFAAIVLSMSTLVFGLGAAALLRAAHEEFATNPTWRAAPEPVFAQQSETSKATIAMLRVDPPLPELKPAVTTTAFAPTDLEPSASPETETAAVSAPENTQPTGAAKPEIRADIKQDASADAPPAQPTAPLEAASAPASTETPATKVAITEAVAPATSLPEASAKSEAAPAPTSEATPIATSETAPAATTEVAAATGAPSPASPASIPPQATAFDPIAKKLASIDETDAKDDLSDVVKAAARAEQRARLRAERARARRRQAAQRARLARQQAAAILPQFPLQQPATDPFGQQQQQAAAPPPRIRHAAQTPTQ